MDSDSPVFACILEGTPNRLFNGVFTVTATNNAGSRTATLTVNISEPIGKPKISHHHPLVQARTNEAIDLIYSNGGRHNTIASCEANPALPDGLTLEVGDNSCLVTGAVEEIIDNLEYQIIATNEGGSDTARLTLDIRSAIEGNVHAITLAANDATYIDQEAPEDNHADDRNLKLKGSSSKDRDAYLQFITDDLLETEIEKAYLKLYVVLFDKRGLPLEVCRSDSGWMQDTLNYNQAPAVSDCKEYKLNNDHLADWMLMDITDLVKRP